MKCKLDFLSLVETWHTEDINLPHCLADYRCIDTKATKVCEKGKGRGGIAIIINN